MIFEYPTNSFEIVLNYIIIGLPTFCMSAYVFCKSQDIKLRTSQVVYLFASGVIFVVLFVLLRMRVTTLSHLFRYLAIPVILGIMVRKRKTLFKTMVIGLISVSLVTIFETVSVFVPAIIIWIVGRVPSGVVSVTISYIAAVLLCLLFMNIKRFKKGFQFIQEDNYLGLGLALSGIVMILKCLNLRDDNDKDYIFIAFLIGVAISGFGLYLWIRRSITELYRKRQQLRSEEHYKEILEERDREIEKLNQSNAYLAKVVHRDNHLMSSLNTSIDMYFNSDDKAFKENLLRELQTLSKERGEQINREQLESKLLPSTGNLLVDGAINDLYIKAAAHGIDFNLTVSSTVDEVIGKFISQTDLQTLLCDHIKDAIIAVESRGETGGKILVNLSKQNDNYCVDIYDSGVAFEPETLSKLGVERVTTHAASGGSGIGFMTTFETLRKAYASLIITEFENRTPFSKSVSFRFDGETAFIIKTYRKEELQPLTARDDMILVD